MLFAGILVAKKSLFVNPVPSGCGGGSVFFVSIQKKCFLGVYIKPYVSMIFAQVFFQLVFFLWQTEIK